uniref:Uncharacterized protein n=1 Tax=Rhizophora mucronata TaxID=61149 RepID=A0A2P2NKW9_RHIMU
MQHELLLNITTPFSAVNANTFSMLILSLIENDFLNLQNFLRQ